MVDEPTNESDDDTLKDGEDGDAPQKPSKVKEFITTIKAALADTKADFKENFKPQTLTTLLAFILFLVPMGLGIWQVQRLHWKTGLINKIEAQQADNAYHFDVLNPFQDWAALDYRRGIARGDMMFLRSIKIRPRTYNGQVGYHLLTPLRLKDGGTVIVNRGWVPEGVDVPSEYWNAENIEVTGILRKPETGNRFTPDNVPDNDEWYWPDLNAMAKHVGVDAVVPIILYEDLSENAQAGTYPIGGQVNTTPRNTHRAYAVTWFLLAVSLIIVWFFYSWQSPEIAVAPTEEGDDESDNLPDDSEKDAADTSDKT